MRSKQRSQAIVEFGLIALLFVGLMFATVDFGLLLNTWLSVSSGTREVARNASVGKQSTFLLDEANRLNMPSVSTVGKSGFCCDATSAVEVIVEYFEGTQLPSGTQATTPCPPWNSLCTPIPKGLINPLYPYGNLGTTGAPQTGASTTCPLPGSPPDPKCRPLSDDLVRVTVVAHGAQIITPLLRPIFGCTNGSNPNCNVPLTSNAVVRYEGAEF